MGKSLEWHPGRWSQNFRWPVLGTHRRDIIRAENGSDAVDGYKGDDKIFGGAGDDYLDGGAGDDYLDGGAEIDTAIYGDVEAAQTLELSSGGALPTGTEPDGPGQRFTIERGSEADVLHSVEKIELSDESDTLEVLANTDLTGLQEIDARGGSIDVLDLSKMRSGINFIDGWVDEYQAEFKNFEKLILTSGKDFVFLSDPDGSLQVLETGNDDDVVYSDVEGLTITFGNGQNVLLHAAYGSVVQIGTGITTVVVSNNILLKGLKASDLIVTKAGSILHGAVGHLGSELR